MTNPLEILASRYTCKAYDQTRKIDEATFAILTECLRLAPSSINIQPWQFLIATTDAAKARITTAMTKGDAHNVPKVMNASHVLIFCTRLHLNDDHLTKIMDSEQAAGRFANDTSRRSRQALCQNYLHTYAQTPELMARWADEQAFIALGQLLMSAHMLGVSATPIGGFDKSVLDEALHLSKRGLRSTVIASLGYASTDDFNQSLPKARLSYEDVFIRLDDEVDTLPHRTV